MHIAAQILAGLVAVEHIYILVLEMFLWNTAYGRRAFGLTSEFAEASAPLAKNQGLYNGFLAAGLLWSLFAPPVMMLSLRHFFLGCVVVAGIYGGFTAKRSIWFVQALPAAIALAVSLLSIYI